MSEQRIKAVAMTNPFDESGYLKEGLEYRDVHLMKDAIYTKNGNPVVVPHKVKRVGKEVYLQWSSGMFHRVCRNLCNMTRKEMAKLIGISDDTAKKLERGARRLQNTQQKLLAHEMRQYKNIGVMKRRRKQNAKKRR